MNHPLPVLAQYPHLTDLHGRLTEFLDLHLPAPVTELDETPDWLGLRRKAAQAGLTALDIDTDGPREGGHLAQGLAMFLAGQRDCDARELFSTGHAAMALRHGSPALVREVGEQIIDQGHLAGVASSEPHSGSDLRGFKTLAVDHGDRLVLSGTKGLISRIEESKGFVVLCKIVHQDDVGAVDLRGVPLSAVWLPMETKGILTETTDPLGMRGWSFGHLHFVGVELDKGYLLGSPGDGRQIFDSHFSAWRLMMSLVCLGAAHAALQESAARTRQRTVGRMALATIPSVAARMGTAAAEVEAATTWCFSLLERIGRGDIDVAACSAAKALATDVAFRAVDIALQLHGSEGYTRHTPMEKRLRDIRGLRIADGPNDTLYSVLAHSMLTQAEPDIQGAQNAQDVRSQGAQQQDVQPVQALAHY